MSIIAYGINHKTAPIALREQLAVADHDLAHSLRGLREALTLPELAIISTCNRTEYYASHSSANDFVDWLAQKHQLNPLDITDYMYVHQDEAAVRHIMRVACGLDSMLLGEAQILGQIKRAYSVAKDCGTIGVHLHRLFQYVFAMTKHVRQETGVGASPVSLAYAAIDLAKRIFADISQTQVMLLGAGETIELAARYFRDLHVANIRIFNRTFTKAKQLAENFNGQAYALTDVPNYLSQSDIIVTATSASLPILGKGMVERALKARRHKPMLMVDLAMPRDIEPEIEALDDVYLYSLKTLQAIIAGNLNKRKQNAAEAKHWIELHVEHYMRWLNSLNTVALVRQFREKFEVVRDQEIQKALQQLANGKSPEVIIARLAHVLTNKFMYQPTNQIRQAGYDSDWHLLEFIKQLFQLTDS